MSGASGFFHVQRERPRERLRILEGHVELEVPEVAAPEALGEPERLGLRVPADVEPSPVVEAGGVTTSVSPSQRPTEYPSQVGFVSFGRLRPSVKIVRCGLFGDS